MLKHFFVATLLTIGFFAATTATVQAQLRQNSEIGLWLGTSLYKGDLGSNLKNIRPAIGAVYRFTLNDYVALRGGLAYSLLHGDDAYVQNAPFQIARNLRFDSHLLEASGQIELHFLKFVAGSHKNYFSPYLTTGLAVFHFKPTAVAASDDERYNLQDLGTEGEHNDYSGHKPYKLWQMAVPVGGGFKYWMAGHWTLFAELTYRNTFTDYIDDVSTTYVNSAFLGDYAPALELADRSPEVDMSPPIGEEGRQRGDSTNKDGYFMFGVGITYTIFSNKCPRSK